MRAAVLKQDQRRTISPLSVDPEQLSLLSQLTLPMCWSPHRSRSSPKEKTRKLPESSASWIINSGIKIQREVSPPQKNAWGLDGRAEECGRSERSRAREWVSVCLCVCVRRLPEVVPVWVKRRCLGRLRPPLRSDLLPVNTRTHSRTSSRSLPLRRQAE